MYRIGFRFGSLPGTWQAADQATVTVTVVANQPPVAVDDTDTVRGSAPLVTYVTLNDLDPNLSARGERLTVVVASTTTAQGALVECGADTDLTGCLYRAPLGFASRPAWAAPWSGLVTNVISRADILWDICDPFSGSW